MAADGAVARVRHPRRGHSVLLAEEPEAPDAVLHEAAYRWGKGFVITDQGSQRFDAPTILAWTGEGVEVGHRLGDLELTVSRRVKESWIETYALRNTAPVTVSVGSVAVSTPWRDVYWSARNSLQEAVHAHLWTGGSDAWVWAAPMDGTGPGIGLVLTDGGLEAYSVESRDAVTSSNVRGHLYLHVTDHARSPHAMGGQRPVVLRPGETYRWAWQLDWYPDLEALHARRRRLRPPLVEAEVLATEVGGTLPLRVAPGATLSAPAPVTATEPGVRHVWASVGGRRSRVSLLFSLPLRDLVERRVRLALDHQRAQRRSDGRRAAFVPYDNESRLTVLPGAWHDWSDTRERVGTALLLQQVRDRGWGDRAELEEALAAYEEFVTGFVVAADGTVADDSRWPGRARLYNFPWFARFLLDQGDLHRAVLIMDRYYTLGGDRFLAFELGPILRALAGRLDASGRDGDAGRMRAHLLGHAAAFLGYGQDLPAHEVNYEQSMVAPLLELLLAAYAERPEAVPPAELVRRLGWLTAFAADQPDVRLYQVPIRHWDAYWFGGLRLWGDVFPHYWSVLSAGVFLSWPQGLLEPAQRARLRRAAQAILRSNLVAFAPDGSATCAFVYPSCVNGRPAHIADPLANDQDWALVYALRFGLE